MFGDFWRSNVKNGLRRSNDFPRDMLVCLGVPFACFMYFFWLKFMSKVLICIQVYLCWKRPGTTP